MEIYQQILDLLPQLLTSIAIVMPFFIAWIIIKSLMKSSFSKKYTFSQSTFVTCTYKVVSIALAILALIALLASLGIDLTSLVAGLGLTGVVFGVALKDIITSLSAGALILFNPPFKLGSKVIVMGTEGKVISIDILYTKIQELDKTYLIPNSKLFSENITIIAD